MLQRLLSVLTPRLMLRLCLLAMVWGGAVFGSASVVRQIVRSKLPGMEGYIRGYVLSYQQALVEASAGLDALLADSRLVEALNAEKTDISGVRRVLYEYRYLNPESRLVLRDTLRNLNLSVEGGPAIELSAEQVAALQNGSRQWLGGHPANPYLVTARPVQGLKPGMPVMGLLAQPLGEVFKNTVLQSLPQPGAEGSPEGQPATRNEPVVTLASRVGGEVWLVSPGKAALPDARLTQVPLDKPQMTSGDDTVTLIRPLARVPGWAVVIDLPMAAVSATASKMRGIMLGLAALLTLALLAQPLLAQLGRGGGKLGRITRSVTTTVATTVTRHIASVAVPLARAMRTATQGESLLEADQPPSGRAGTATPARRSTPAASGGSSASSSSGGSSVHQRALRMGGGSTTPPPPSEPLAPRLPEEDIRALVKRAIEQDLLELAYQPIFSAGDSVPVMHEVYVRLRGPAGELEAHNFLPQAAQLGLISQIDAQVFNNVMLAHFHKGALPVTPLALNLAGSTMASLAYLSKLDEIPDARVLNHLVFEVRSADLLQDTAALNFLKKQQARGIKLAVDYFGGGKAMLEATKKLGFDYVKVDALKFWYDLALRKELVGLARVAAHLHLPMVLEKIEIIQMEVMARKIGIPFLQGYHMQRPGPELATKQLKGWTGSAAAPPSAPAGS